MIHNWQYTKSRAMFFQETKHSSCPLGCGMNETAMHHLSCTTLPASDLRSINRWMSHQNIAPPIQIAIMRSLKAWISDEPIPQFNGDTSDKLDRMTALAHAEQSLIGWTQAFKGRLSRKWTTAQGIWYDHMRHNLPTSQKFPKISEAIHRTNPDEETRCSTNLLQFKPLANTQ